MVLLPLTKPHHSFSPHQSQSGEVSLRLATLSCSHPGTPVLSLLGAGGRCVMGVVGWAERQRERERGVSTRTRQRHHMISQHEFCFRAWRVNTNTQCVNSDPLTHTHTHSPVLTQRASSTYSLVEGFGLVSQVLRLCHEIVQFLSSFQKTFHRVVLQKKHKYLLRKQCKVSQCL